MDFQRRKLIKRSNSFPNVSIREFENKVSKIVIIIHDFVCIIIIFNLHIEFIFLLDNKRI
jgi:type IV secretory pathway TrbL component